MSGESSRYKLKEKPLDLAWLEWTQERQDRALRVPLMLPIQYEYFSAVPLSHDVPIGMPPEAVQTTGTGMTSNVSDKGLCLLLDWQPKEGGVFRVAMPARAGPTIPTLAEVRWIRHIPLGLTGVCAVGMRFLV